MSDITLTPDNFNQKNPQNDDDKPKGVLYEASERTIKIYMEEVDDNQTENGKKEKESIDLMKAYSVPIQFDSAKANFEKEYVLYDIYDGYNQRPQSFWVQFNQGIGMRSAMENNYGSPLDYEPESRNRFVKVVFTILFIMLVITAIAIAFVLIMPALRRFFLVHGMVLAIAGGVLLLGLSYAMSCSACTRQSPCSIICLFLAVLGFSLVACFITARYKTQLVLYAAIATTVTVFVCILLACTRFDFTKWFLYLIVISVAFAVISMIIGVTWLVSNTYYKPLHIAILIIGSLIHVVILVMELQMVLGGKTIELNEDDYALGAYLLYTSIMDIFLKMVVLTGLLDD